MKDSPIEYIGTPSEWKSAHFGDIANKVNKAIKADLKPKQVKMYKLTYRDTIVAKSAPYAVIMAKFNECKRNSNFQTKYLKITKQ